MAITFRCQCGRQYKVAEKMAGNRAKCKSCGQQMQIPDVPLETLEPLTPLTDASTDDILSDAATLIPAVSITQFQQSQQQLHTPKSEPSRPKFQLPVIDITIFGLSFYQLLTMFGFLVAFLVIVYYFTPGTGARPYYTAEAFDEGTRRVDLGNVSRGWTVKIYGATSGVIEERVVTEQFIGGMKTKQHIVLDEVRVTGPDSGASGSQSSGRLLTENPNARGLGIEDYDDRTTRSGEFSFTDRAAPLQTSEDSYEIYWERNHRGLKVTLNGRRIPQAFWNVFQ